MMTVKFMLYVYIELKEDLTTNYCLAGLWMMTVKFMLYVYIELKEDLTTNYRWQGYR